MKVSQLQILRMCLMPFLQPMVLQMQETTIRMLNLLVRRGITVIVLMSSYSSLQLISGDEIYVKNGKQITEDELYQILYSMPYNEQ